MKKIECIDTELIRTLQTSTVGTAQAIANELSKINQIVSIDPEMGLVRIRRVLDLLLRNVAEQNGIRSGTKPLEQILVELTRNCSIPDLVEKHCRVIKEFGNFATHGNELPISGLSFEAVSDVELAICAQSLMVLVRWYQNVIMPQNKRKELFAVLDSDQITNAYIDQAVEIDKLNYSDQLVGINSYCYRWHERNQDIYTMIIDPITDNLVGYINAMPLEKDYYNQIKKGKTIDTMIPDNVIRKYDFPDFYFLYFSSIGIHPSYQNTSAFRILYETFVNKLIDLARKEIFLVEIIADAVTPEGLRLCKYAGMKEYCKTNHNSAIYSVMLLPPSLRITTAAGKTLVSYYEKKYQDFRDIIDLVYSELDATIETNSAETGPADELHRFTKERE